MFDKCLTGAYIRKNSSIRNSGVRSMVIIYRRKFILAVTWKNENFITKQWGKLSYELK